ncbi:MAG: NADP-dependent malic enzyme [Candidatus Cloacimonetes bacterium]|nr:NADP-dependent malic enzyme [Candidatus Cloacimonadota bacterium]
MPGYDERSMILHEHLRGKIEVRGKLPIDHMDDLSTVYTPGVAAPCLAIAEDVTKAKKLTIKSNSIAVVTDGSAVLGLGNIGAHAAIPVMEGKALIFRQFAGLNAWPICVETQDTQEIIDLVKNIAPVFGGINLEDIAAPRCFEIEKALQDIGIPVFHDDQHGTAIVLLAGLINACKVLDKSINDLKVVISGAGAAGASIAKLLNGEGNQKSTGQHHIKVKEIVVCDSKGALHAGRTDLNSEKIKLLDFTNPNNVSGSVKESMRDMDVFIGVSKGGLINAEDVKTMAKDPIIFALANPDPEILPEEAKAGGAAIVATGRSDFPNQVNNALVFPGIFRGALDAGSPRIYKSMYFAAAWALAHSIVNPTVDRILPETLDRAVVPLVARAVKLNYVPR